MAQLTEILDKEHSRTMPEQKREIYLYYDGSFFRTYEWSAWLIVRYIRQLTVIRRAVKSIDAEVVHVGFPKTTLDKYKLDGTEVIENENDVVLRLPQSFFPPEEDAEQLQTDFVNWRQAQPVTITKKKNAALPAIAIEQTTQPQTLSGIMQRVLAFNVINSTPLQCMQFVSDIQQQLTKLI